MLTVTIIFSCMVLIKLNYVDSVPVYPESNWRRTQTSQPSGWSKFYKPVELKPMSWDSNTAPPTQRPTTRARSGWDSLAADARRDARAMDLYHSTKNPVLGSNQNFKDLNTGAVDWVNVPPSDPYKPMELLPADLVLGTTTPPPPMMTEPTKAPEIDHWIPEFNIRLRPRSDHVIGPPNSTVFVHGEGFMKPMDRQDFTHPSFNILGFIQGLIREPLQSLKLRILRDQPYFVFHIPDFHKPGRRFKRSHRVKRHHPTILQSVLGELQNYALVPIQSSNGKTSYILLKNPKFVIGASALGGSNPTAAPQMPAVIQIARQNPVQVAPQSPTVIQIGRQSPVPSQQPRVMYNQGVIQSDARPTYNPPQTSVREQTWQRQPTGGSSRQQQQQQLDFIGRQQQQQQPNFNGRQQQQQQQQPDFIGRQQQQQQQQPDFIGRQQQQQPIQSSNFQSARQLDIPDNRRQYRMQNPSPAPIRKPAYGRLGAPSNNMMSSQNVLPPRMQMPVQTSGSSGSNAGHIQKTEVVETVVETQQAAVAKNDVAAANVATEQASNVGSDIGGGGGSAPGVVSNTAAAESQKASAASSSEVKKQKKVVTKKTTTTKIKGDGAGGAVQEVSQVVEHSVHNNAAVATADTAASSSAASSASDAVVMNVPPSGVADAASASSSSAAASSSSAASASNQSVKKTIKKTTVTKTKLGDQAGAAVLGVDPVPTAILSDKANGPSQAAPMKKAKTAILSDNNPLQAAEKQAALIATESPKKVAARRPNRRRKRPQRRRRPKMRKTTMAPTTEAAEVEMEEMTTPTTTDPYWATATPTGAYYGGFTPPTVAPYPPQPEPAGWRSGPDPILGPNDRINTTDVPEEIEPLPDKTPAEKRAELRKLARERARKAGRKLNARAGMKQQQVVKQKQLKAQPAEKSQSQNTLPKPRQIQTRNNRVPTSQGPTTTQFATEPTPETRPPPRHPRRPEPRRGRRPGWRGRPGRRGRPRNRPPPRSNNPSNGRVRDIDLSEPKIRDPITRWMFNNMESEVLEKLMPLFVIG